MNDIKQYMIKFWIFVQLAYIFYKREGYFILKFHSFKDKYAMLMRGPHIIHNMTMLLRDWKSYFFLKRDMLRTLPIWINFIIYICTQDARRLSKIRSALGKPLVTDECTTNKLRMSYAQILIEVDITQKLAKDITIKDNEWASYEVVYFGKQPIISY